MQSYTNQKRQKHCNSFAPHCIILGPFEQPVHVLGSDKRAEVPVTEMINSKDQSEVRQ